MLRKKNAQKISLKGYEIEDSLMSFSWEDKGIMEDLFLRKGVNYFWWIILLSVLFLTARVFYLDFFQGEHYSQIAQGNRIRSVTIKAPRGNIFDRHGKILAKNISSIDAVIIPAHLPGSGEEKKRMAKKLAEILEINSGNAEIMLQTQDRQSFAPILLKENISRDQALIIVEKNADFPGIFLEKTAIRNYSNSLIFSHILGYEGKITSQEIQKNPQYQMTDYIGKTGLEKKYEKDLKGENGATQVEVDAKGKVKKVVGIINPQPGSDLILNIEEELQKKIYDSLSAVLEKTVTKTAAAVAIDPRNGGILAMVSLPSFDNNLFAKGISQEEYNEIIENKDLPLLNRCIAGEYPPGSTLKLAVAAAALSEKTITPSTVIDGLGGVLRIGAWSFGDWKAHGPSDVRSAIAQSNDIFFYTIGGGYGNISGLGMDRMKKYENMFGFGNSSGVDIPGEASGFIPDEKWKEDKFGEKWYIGDSYHCAIGQGFITATPLQLANYTVAIANGGILYSPKIVNRIKLGKTEKIIEPEIIRKNFISSEVMNVLREGMKMTVESGTAQSLKNVPVEVAGKTGTAQYGNEDKTHAWFTSFAPYENPEIAMVVLVEGGGEGHSSSVPVTEEVYNWYFKKE